MKESNELFELCKQVYEATGWGRMDNGSPTDEYYAANPVSILLNKRDFIKGWQIRRWEDFGESGRLNFSLGKGQAYPLYTSDYLLEKLANLDLGGLMMEQSWDDDGDIWWGFGRSSEADGLPVADTPLKALLKLTIALSEAGELDNE